MPMKKLFAAAALIASLPTLAAAKDVTLTLNDQEQAAFAQVLDQATRGGGLQAASATVYFQNKLQQAAAAASAPPVPVAKPADESIKPAKGK